MSLSSDAHPRRPLILKPYFPLIVFVCPALFGHLAQAQALDLNSTRPTVANSVGIPSKGALQVESGHDSYPEVFPGDQHTSVLTLFYASR